LVVVINNIGGVLYDIKNQLMNTQLMFSCANVPPGAQCSGKFQKLKYQGGSFRLIWIYRGIEKTMEDIVLSMPENI